MGSSIKNELQTYRLMSTFPFIRFEDIPLDTETLRSNDSIIVVKDNTFTARVPADLVVPIRSVTKPSDLNEPGTAGDMSWDDDSFYVYNGKAWGRIPFNIDWTDKAGRFLDVSKVMSLSSSEVENVWNTINITYAAEGESQSGLVRIASELNDEGSNAVPGMNLFRTYVENIKGETGETGPRGYTGEIGPRGYTGPKGDRGDRGSTGPRGYQGEKGPRGFQGSNGKDGLPGLTGPRGSDGLPGPPGPTGPRGGPRGATGPTGPRGRDGVDGQTGPAGPAGGPKGETGPRGATGPRGSAGAQGAMGPRGEKGDRGAIGPTGPRGLTGPTGPTGTVTQELTDLKNETKQYAQNAANSAASASRAAQDVVTEAIDTVDKWSEESYVPTDTHTPSSRLFVAYLASTQDSFSSMGADISRIDTTVSNINTTLTSTNSTLSTLSVDFNTHAGQMATVNTAGHVKLGTGTSIATDYAGLIGLTSTNQMALPVATLNESGAVRISSTNGTNLACIGMNNGRLQLRCRASYSGVQVANNALYIQTSSDTHPTYAADIGDVCTDQAGGKLCVNKATTDKAGAVLLSSGDTDTRATAVPTMAQFKALMDRVAALESAT